jgi:hypothetical protein
MIAMAVLGGVLLGSAAAGQSLAIKNNESVPVGSVYWIANCKSILKNFIGIDVLSGPPEVTLSLKEGMVHATRQNCSKPIKGATVMATAKGVKTSSSTTLRYRVRCNTLDGERQSSHTLQLDLFP